MDTVISPSGHAAALWAGLLILVMLVLSVLVVRQRRKHHIVIGDGGIDEVQQAVRAFGNAAEYVPAGIGALAVLALVGAQPIVIHAMGLLLFAGRLAHGWGLSRNLGPTTPRVVGVMLTWIGFLVAGALLLFYAVP